MSDRIFTASERKVLIRLAASLPKGSAERKVLLAALTKAGNYVRNWLKGLHPGDQATIPSPRRKAFAHVWFDTGVAQTDDGRPIPDSGEWEVIISSSPDPMNRSPRGRVIAKDKYRYADPKLRNAVYVHMEKSILRSLSRY